MSKERLDKLICSQGMTTRTQAKDMIRIGEVKVNGIVIKACDYKVDTEKDSVSVNGREYIFKKHIYIMMNKPQGVVSATTDPKNKTVIDILPENLKRKGLFPAGRLDKDTEGFMLITDDGDFAHKILAPKNHIPKTYLVRVDKKITQEVMDAFAKGIPIGGGECTSPAIIKLVEDVDNPLCEVTIFEGMYHQIKRMFERFGMTVLYLKRLRMGNLELDGNLSLGQARELLPKELQMFL